MTAIEIKEIFQYVLQPGSLSFSERDFVESLKKWYKKTGSLSESQLKALSEIKKAREASEKHLY